MRTGRRVALLCALLSLALCGQARAADSLHLIVDNQSIALGAVTTFAAHVDADGDFRGGHVAFKYQGADSDCAATPDADPGNDATEAPVAVGAGPQSVDVGGQELQLDVGMWLICGWLVDDTTGAVVATGAVGVQVIPYQGSMSISVKKIAKTLQVVLAYSTSEPGQLYATIQQRNCSRYPSGIPKRGAVLLLPRGGRYIGSDGGLGKSVPLTGLAPGRWHVCAWLTALDGSVGPVVRTFSVPRARRPRGGRAAG